MNLGHNLEKKIVEIVDTNFLVTCDMKKPLSGVVK